MSFLFRTATALNVGAAVALKTIKYHRPVLNCVHFATSAYGVGNIVRLDTYENRRQTALDKLKSDTETLRLRIVSQLDSGSEINARDIQELVFTANETDVDLVIAALKKMELQSERMRFSSFQMDAVTMRMFSFLDLPDKALEAFLDEDLRRCFVGYNSIVILLEMLYRHGMYQDVLRCVDYLEQCQNFTAWCSKGVNCFYLSSCLKVNTSDSLNKGYAYYEKNLIYKEPGPETLLLALVIAVRVCPEKVNPILDSLNRKQRTTNPKVFATYRDIQTNALLQVLSSSQNLSDIVSCLSDCKCTLAKDTFDSVMTLAKEKGYNKPDNITQGCKILDVSLADWVDLENTSVLNKILENRPVSLKR